MTVKAFLEKLSGKDPRYGAAMERITHIWSNDACLGYAVSAMRAAGLSRKHIKAVVVAMQNGFNVSVDEAEEIYYHF